MQFKLLLTFNHTIRKSNSSSNCFQRMIVLVIDSQHISSID